MKKTVALAFLFLAPTLSAMDNVDGLEKSVDNFLVGIEKQRCELNKKLEKIEEQRAKKLEKEALIKKKPAGQKETSADQENIGGCFCCGVPFSQILASIFGPQNNN